MKDLIQHMILPAACGGAVCVVEVVQSNESGTRVTLVTQGPFKPSLKAAVERVIELYPYALRIRVMSSDQFDLQNLCTFRLFDGSWFEQPPPCKRPRRKMSHEEQKNAVQKLLLGSACIDYNN
ncbi:hypothetical protein [Ruegeria arenilitoris]|uniref:hypothetical protein n=1 Tax=Ruegeria arenilitoris TaxID=1173585 RepID=UPI00147D7318|nr:hypothetical protein [Ruegeria arenilitoris]